MSNTQLLFSLVQKRHIKVSGRRVASRNPIKALSARKDLCTEYVDVRTGAAEREMKRLNAEKCMLNIEPNIFYLKKKLKNI